MTSVEDNIKKRHDIVLMTLIQSKIRTGRNRISINVDSKIHRTSQINLYNIKHVSNDPKPSLLKRNRRRGKSSEVAHISISYDNPL